MRAQLYLRPVRLCPRAGGRAGLWFDYLAAVYTARVRPRPPRQAPASVSRAAFFHPVPFTPYCRSAQATCGSRVGIATPRAEVVRGEEASPASLHRHFFFPAAPRTRRKQRRNEERDGGGDWEQGQAVERKISLIEGPLHRTGHRDLRIKTNCWNSFNLYIKINLYKANRME